MKITMNIDCTPEEARAFFGLPDVKPMQEKLLREMEERLRGKSARNGARGDAQDVAHDVQGVRTASGEIPRGNGASFWGEERLMSARTPISGRRFRYLTSSSWTSTRTARACDHPVIDRRQGLLRPEQADRLAPREPELLQPFYRLVPGEPVRHASFGVAGLAMAEPAHNVVEFGQPFFV